MMWNCIGILILFIDIFWIVFYYYYATVKIYNFQEMEKYQYLGYLWIHKRKGQYYLKISQEMIDNSVTTEYKIVSQSAFHRLKRREKIYINFADQYGTEVRMASQITVKNYIATSHQL